MSAPIPQQVMPTTDQFFAVVIPDMKKHMSPFSDPVLLSHDAVLPPTYNDEVAVFNIEEPVSAFLYQHSEHFEVTLSYWNFQNYEDRTASYRTQRTQDKKFPFENYSSHEEALAAVEGYIAEVYNNVKETETRGLSISTDTLPKNLMQFTHFQNLKWLKIQTKDFDEVLRFAKTTKMRVKTIKLDDSNSSTVNIETMKEIFNTAFFQQAIDIEIRTQCDIRDDTFLGFKSKNMVLHLPRRTITGDAIKQKVQEIGISSIRQKCVIIVENQAVRFNIDDLYPMLDGEVNVANGRAIKRVYVKSRKNRCQLIITNNPVDLDIHNSS